MTDIGTLGRVLIETGKAISAQSNNMPSKASIDPAHALLPKVDLMNRKLGEVEGLLAAQPAAIAQGVAIELRESLDGLTTGLQMFRNELALQNQISREMLESTRDLKKLTHLIAVMMVDVLRKPPFGGSEIPTECARQVNQLIEPGSLDTPLAFVDSGSRSRGSGNAGTVTFYPRTGADIGYMNVPQLCELLAELCAKEPSDFKGLDLEQLQHLVCKKMGLVP